MLALTPLKYAIDSEKSTVTGITVCITRGPEITDVTTLLQLLPQRVMSCPVPPSGCYISFLYWAFTHRGIFMNTPVQLFSVFMPLKIPLYPFLWVQNQWAWECPG